MSKAQKEPESPLPAQKQVKPGRCARFPADPSSGAGALPWPTVGEGSSQ